MTKRLVLLAMVLPLLALGACNTVEGAGQDMQSAGRAVERARLRHAAGRLRRRHEQGGAGGRAVLFGERDAALGRPRLGPVDLRLLPRSTLLDLKPRLCNPRQGGVVMSTLSEMKRPLMLMLVIVPMLALGACNTVEGAGQDMQSAGRSVERTAERNK